jgi:hypothetical protein
MLEYINLFIFIASINNSVWIDTRRSQLRYTYDRQTTPLLNLSELIKEIDEKYRFHLIWAQDAERFEIIITGIRASQMLDVMDLEKTNRYATSFQNRILKGIHGLAIIDQYEAKAVQVLQVPPINTVDEDESVIDTLEE